MQDRFAQQRRFEAALERHQTRGRAASGWLMISAPAGMDAGAQAGAPGWPGLWKPERGDDGTPDLTFAVPLAALDAIEDDDHGDNDLDDLDMHLEPLLQWALATLQGRVPEGWSPPGAAVAERIDDADRSVRFGGFMTRLEIQSTPDALRLTLPVARIADDLGAQRRRWLDVALADGAARTMARLGVRDGGVEAEVDLRGVPSSLLAPLVAAAVQSLAACYRCVVVPANVIGGSPVSRALERSPEDWRGVFQPVSNSSDRSSST